MEPLDRKPVFLTRFYAHLRALRNRRPFFELDSLLPSSLLRRGRALRLPALDLLRRDQHFRGHAWDERALRIVQADFQHDGSDVSLAAAHIALRSEISFHSLEKNLAAGHSSTRQPHAKHIAISNVIGV